MYIYKLGGINLLVFFRWFLIPTDRNPTKIRLKQQKKVTNYHNQLPSPKSDTDLKALQNLGFSGIMRRQSSSCMFCLFASIMFILTGSFCEEIQWLLETLSLQCPHKSVSTAAMKKKMQFFIFSLVMTYFFKSLSPVVFRIFSLIPTVVQFHSDLSCYGIFS